MPIDGPTHREDNFFHEYLSSRERAENLNDKRLEDHHRLVQVVETAKRTYLENFAEKEVRGPINNLLKDSQVLNKELGQETAEQMFMESLNSFTELMKTEYVDIQYPKQEIRMGKGERRTEFPIKIYGDKVISARIKQVYGQELPIDSEDQESLVSKLADLLKKIHLPLDYDFDSLKGMEETIKAEQSYLKKFENEGQIALPEEINDQIKSYYEERFGMDFPGREFAEGVNRTSVAIDHYDTLLKAIYLNKIINLKIQLETESLVS